MYILCGSQATRPWQLGNSSRVRVHTGYFKETEAQNTWLAPARTEVQKLHEPESIIINPIKIPSNENLIASTSNDPTIIAIKAIRVLGDKEPGLSSNTHYQAKIADGFSDSIKLIAPKKGSTMDLSVQQVIKFKNGKKVLVGVIYQSADTLFCHSASNPEETIIVKVEDVDTLLQVKHTDFSTGEVIDSRKTEKLSKVGLIFSIVGLIPIIGLPFGILAVSFGAISLRRIKRNPELWKGKERSVVSIMIGILAMVLSIVLLSTAKYDTPTNW